MTPSVNRRLNRLINTAYLAMILGLAYLFIKYCLGVVFPFVFAFFVAMIVQKPTNRCFQKIKKGKGIIATVFVLLFILILASIVSLLGAQIVSGGKEILNFVREKISDFPTFIENIESGLLKAIAVLPDSVEGKLRISIMGSMERFKELTAAEAASLLVRTASDSENFNLKSLITPIGGGVWNIVKSLPSALISGVIAIVASCFMAADYDRLVGFLKHQLKPAHRNGLSRSKALLLQTLSQLFRAYGVIMFITFCEMVLALYLFKLLGIYNSSYIFIIAAITSVVDILPVLGTGTIVVPWALYSLITGKISLAIALVILYVIVLVLRQIIEPKLVANQLGLPPVLTIAAMYLGTQLFGFLGIFLLPIICIMIKRLNDEGILHIWKPLETPAAAPETAEAAESAPDDAGGNDPA